jgi:hypothetical protein
MLKNLKITEKNNRLNKQRDFSIDLPFRALFEAEMFLEVNILLEVCHMSKRGLGVILVVVCLVFAMSSCILIKGTPVGKTWAGTITLDSAVGSVDAGTYVIAVTLKFEWLFGNTTIKGGTFTFTLPTVSEERASAAAYSFNITGGSYNETTKELTFTGTEVDTSDTLKLLGTVTSGAIAGGSVISGALVIGDFDISEQ